MESTISTINHIIDDKEVEELSKSADALKKAEEIKAKKEEINGSDLVGPIQPDSETAMTICDIDRLLMPPPAITSRTDSTEEKGSDDEGRMAVYQI